MKTDVLHQIDLMLGMGDAPVDESGSLAAVAQMLAPLGPVMLWLADGTGQIVAAHAVCGSSSPVSAAHLTELSRGLLRRMTRCSSLYMVDVVRGDKLAVSLTADDGMPAILGCILACRDGSGRGSFESLTPALKCGAALAWKAVQQARASDAATVRMRQLEHERDTLKASYTHIMNSAIEEREQRLREQQRYTDKLEAAVARRSADLRKALGRAKAANDSKSEFLANMSHELRTPLTAILGYAEMLIDPRQSEQQRSQCIQTIHRNGQHLLSIINDILDLSKIEAGKMTTEIIACSPVQLIDDIAEMMRMRAEEKDLRFVCEFRGPMPESIQSDPTRIRQILLNLVGNAVKFTEQGEVRIVTELLQPEQGGEARLRFDVIDTGIGMSEQQLRLLFQPFMQTDTSTTRKYGGTGLGLVICQRLAEMLGGQIVARSSPNEGSCFTVTINVGRLEGVAMLPEPQAKRPGATGPVSGTGQKIMGRILVAEDGPDNQRLLLHILRQAGAEVQVAGNGRIAVEAALGSMSGEESDQPFDLVLMDMQMPELDGYDATAELRRAGFTAPIIALTAHAMGGDRERCLSAGCDDYATKPINRAALLALIHRHIERYRATLGGRTQAA